MANILKILLISEADGSQDLVGQILERHVGVQNFTLQTSTYDDLNHIEADIDVILIESDKALHLNHIGFLTARFYKKTIIALCPCDESMRQQRIDAGVDEMMSLDELDSALGFHLFEKVIAYKRLAYAELQMEQSEERFRGIIEYSHDIIMLLDEDITIIYTSPAFERLLGYEPWEVLGQSILDFIHIDDREDASQKLGTIARVWASDGMAMQYRFSTKDGVWRDFETIATNLLNADTVRAIVLNSRDMTELHRTETALEKERELVEQQRTFVSMLSHEFRTPLAIIDGNAQIIERRGGMLDKKVLKLRAHNIRRGVDRLIDLIETILSGYAVESGELKLNVEKSDIKVLLKKACDERRDLSISHDIVLSIAEDVPDILMLDSKIVEHVVVNLLSNAVKYSPGATHVNVDLSIENGQVKISVQDFGVGIPEDEVARLFQKYFRASTSSGIPGSGMGLSLVKTFVEMHDGTITLKSVVGEGTEFVVRLPLVLP